MIRDRANHDEISSYPSFATPQEVGDAVVKAGFDVIETATNHIDDFGLDLIKEELQYWENRTSGSDSDRDQCHRRRAGCD